MSSTTSSRQSTTSDRRSRTLPDGRPRIDESVFTAVGSVQAPITVESFRRWFACFATGGVDR